MTGFSDRRGSIFDLFLIVFVLAVAAVGVVVFVHIFEGINTSIQASDIGSEGKQVMNNFESQNAWVVDFIFIMVLFGLPLAAALSAFLNNIPPFLYVIGFGLWLFVIVLANIFGDAYVSLASDPSLSSTIASIPMTHFVMSHFVLYIIACIFIVSFGVYVKSRVFLP